MRIEFVHLKDRFPFLGENGCDPVLKLYLQDNLEEMKREDVLRPVILLCPGGGYAMVSQREAEPIALQFLPEGYQIAELTYSVPGHRFPTQLREVAASMEVIYENAAAWHMDTGRIAVLGFSAGGHLAAHYCVDYDCPEVREVFPESKPVNAGVLCYPVITGVKGSSHMGSFRNLVGHHPLTEEEEQKFGLYNRVTPNTPPTFIWSTATDAHVPVVNSLWYATALAENGVPFSLHIYPKGGHGLATVDHQTNDSVLETSRMAADWLPKAKAWLAMTFSENT